ncbi:MAG: glycosyltransferase family 4 protein [Chloroflexi bacterium]|nr:glycosyltransferase family 4 protein [Chloroflexota bacterium]
MRILFVAMPDSVHTARWISQISDQGWDIYLFPVYIGRVHPAISNLTVFGSLPARGKDLGNNVRFVRWTILLFWLDYLIARITRSPCQRFTEKALAAVMRWIQPDIVHSLEIQRAGYLTLSVKEKQSGKFPVWIVTNWGSDIHLFGRLSEHEAKIRAVLGCCDYYSCECQRDIALAGQLGFRGTTLPVLPNTGGFHLGDIAKLKSAGKPSGRRMILLKGYQHFAGRALVGLQSLRLCVGQLEGYTIAVFSASDVVRIAIELFQQDTQIPVKIIPKVSHEEMLRIYGNSRLYIGLSISDAISTSLLEAMVMGAFPIQSCTACADEWIEDGVSGIIVPPEDPHVIAEAIRRALADDALVDRAAGINTQTVSERLEYSVIQPQVVEIYQWIFDRTT